MYRSDVFYDDFLTIKMRIVLVKIFFILNSCFQKILERNGNELQIVGFL